MSDQPMNPIGEKIQTTIFDEMGLADLSLDEKQEILEHMNELVMQRTLLAVAEKLEQAAPAAEVERIEAMTDQAQQFAEIQKYVPNMADILDFELQAVKHEVVELSQTK